MSVPVSASCSSSRGSLLESVREDRLRETIEKLSSWHTRNTNRRELFEVAEWLAGQYAAIPGMQVELMPYVIEPGKRVPERKEVLQVIATLPGERDKRVLVGGHFDSLNLSEPIEGRAPGANDDGSGTALALEAARALAHGKWRNTLVFCAFSGEEQGLLGATALAERALREDWQIEGFLNNDMVGNSRNKRGEENGSEVRLFSANPDSTGQNSRELARFIEYTTRSRVEGHFVKLVLRKDRFARGGDHTPFAQRGFNAVRFTEMHEEYSRQHTPEDLPESVDFSYLAGNTRLNVVALAELANAGEAPKGVKLDLGQSYDTTLSWQAAPGVSYVVYRRDTRSSAWEEPYAVGEVDHVKIDASKDDNFYAVGAAGGVPVPVEE